MNIHADIIEDFGRALADLHDVLVASGPQEEVRDAQVFSFIRANDVFLALIRNIYTENCDDDVMDPEQMIIALCALDLVTEDQAKRLIDQSVSADLVSLDRSWFDVPEDVQYFDDEVSAIATYSDDMKTLLENVRKVGTLVTYEEYHEGH